MSSLALDPGQSMAPGRYCHGTHGLEPAKQHVANDKAIIDKDFKKSSSNDVRAKGSQKLQQKKDESSSSVPVHSSQIGLRLGFCHQYHFINNKY